MNVKNLLSYAFLVFLPTTLFSQQNFNATKFEKQEIALLDLISKDTISPLNIQLDGEIFKFGRTKPALSSIALIKNKKDIYVQALGTGRLFKILKNEVGDYQLQKLDSTFFNGANFHALTFSFHDTLFQLGGDGHWHIRGILTYFSNKTHEWELYSTNRQVNTFFSETYGLMYKVDYHNNKLYTSNSFIQANFPATLMVESIDSSYELDIHSHSWKTLGKTTPELMSIITQNKASLIDIGKFLVFQNYLDFYWLDFANNRYGKLNAKINNELKEAWLSLYTTNAPYKSFQFAFGNTIYFIKLNNNNDLSYKTYTIPENSFNFENNKKVYTPVNPFWDSIVNNYEEAIKPIIIGLVSIGFLIYFFIKLNKRQKIPKQVADILNQNFFHSLSVIEKELLEVLYQHHLKGETISTKLINKIVGVQQKDVMTQNKTRSDYFVKINQKFKLATQKDTSLIIKFRDSEDKRQYNYGLHEEFAKELGGLLKN
jgi:hypothetical protein